MTWASAVLPNRATAETASAAEMDFNFLMMTPGCGEGCENYMNRM